MRRFAIALLVLMISAAGFGWAFRDALLDAALERALKHVDCLDLLVLVALLALEVDQHVLGLAELLQSDLAQAQAAQARAQIADVAGRRGAYLYHYSPS